MMQEQHKRRSVVATFFFGAAGLHNNVVPTFIHNRFYYMKDDKTTELQTKNFS